MLDTKLKSNKKNRLAGLLLSFILLSAIAAGMIALYPVFVKNGVILQERTKELDEKRIKEEVNTFQVDFLKQLYRGNYCLYLDFINQTDGEKRSPAEIFLPGFADNRIQDDEGRYEGNTTDVIKTPKESERQNFIESFNRSINDWYTSYLNGKLERYGLEYYIKDNKTGKVLTNTVSSLNRLTENSSEALNIKAPYTFYAVFNYDKDGELTIPELHGLKEEDKNVFKALDINKDVMKAQVYDASWSAYLGQIQSPSDVTIIYASKSNTFYMPDGINLNNNNSWRESWAFGKGGFRYAYFFALFAVILLALLLPFNRSFGLGGGIEGKIPLEIGLTGIAAGISCYDGLRDMAMETAKGSFLDFSDYSIVSVPYWLLKILDYGANYIVWMVLLISWFIIILSLRSVFTLGIKRYAKERSLCGQFLTWLIYSIKKFLASLSRIDLTDNTNKAIIKILAVNFVILLLLCSIWLVGIAVLILYTIILFFIMRKYMEDIKYKYGILLNAARRMAKGNLEVSVEEDLGIFNPLKEELSKVQFGFKKAVEEETKSQNMKTELITNVSHDLKTPLTAIITYINLLKEENITEEERNSYIDTLDKKSLRLKRLIEDLFEISKASSNNISLELVEVDLAALIKQVQLELSDKIAESNVEFRTQFPEEKVILKLDSEKTYRIFENLIMNIIKYAMPGTRAYVEVFSEDSVVTVCLKNVSAAELNMNPEEITERFVRGDESRNTEGSGLGLAIVKNFVELQAGKFQIQLDGDLFKAIIQWEV